MNKVATQREKQKSIIAPAFTFERDWDRDGMIVWENDKTISRYRELKNTHISSNDCDIFFAFGRMQYEEGLNNLQKRLGRKDVKVYSAGAGLYGTSDGIKSFIEYYETLEQKIAMECDPQEVYCYEFNNHESCISYDGDRDAMSVIIRIFGIDEAHKIKRFRDFYSIEEIDSDND